MAPGLRPNRGLVVMVPMTPVMTTLALVSTTLTLVMTGPRAGHLVQHIPREVSGS
jgi:hypothetical protein